MLYIAPIGLAVLLMMILTGAGVLHIPVLDGVLSFVISPMQRAASSVSNGVTNWLVNMFYRSDLEDEYLKLSEQYNNLLIDAQRMPEMEREIERLSALLGYAQSTPENTYEHARVISVVPGSWFSSFTIDKGTDDGIKRNMTVLTADGLIGRVDQADAHSARVISIIDGRSSVAGLIERTRDNGVIKGNVYITTEDDMCRMSYLPLNADVVPGDVVRTSGLDGLFPKGLVIGTVREVSRGTGSDFYVVVKPSADFRRLEDVLVIVAPFDDSQNAGN